MPALKPFLVSRTCDGAGSCFRRTASTTRPLRVFEYKLVSRPKAQCVPVREASLL